MHGLHTPLLGRLIMEAHGKTVTLHEFQGHWTCITRFLTCLSSLQMLYAFLFSHFICSNVGRIHLRRERAPSCLAQSAHQPASISAFKPGSQNDDGLIDHHTSPHFTDIVGLGAPNRVSCDCWEIPVSTRIRCCC